MRPSREMKKVALARLEAPVVEWMEENGDEFPILRDLCHIVATQIDAEREQL